MKLMVITIIMCTVILSLFYLSANPLMSTEGEIGNFLGNNFFHIFSLRLTLGVCSGTTYLHESAHPVM